MNRSTSNIDSMRWISAILGGFACLLYALYIGQAIHVERALYADGANFFVELLSKEQGWPIADDSKHIRLFVNLLNQLPVAIALKLGVENLRLLKIFFGAGMFIIPALIYAFCFTLSRRAGDYRVFFFAIASLVSCAMPSDIFILNQSFTSLALVWILIHYLLLSFNVRWFDWVVILLVSLLLFRAHESLIVWGGISFMGAAAVIWVRDGRNISNKNLHVYTIGILGLGQLAFVAFWQATHPVAQQTSAFLQLITLLMPGELWIGNTRISVLFVCILLVVFIYDAARRYFSGLSKPANAIFFLIFVSLGGLLLATGAIAIFSLDFTSPSREYSYRFLMTFGSAGWMSMSIFGMLWKVNLDGQTRRLCFIALSLGLISASMWQISNNIQWSFFSNAASQVLRHSTGALIDPDRVRERLATLGNESVYKYHWPWAWPVFGMSLQDNGRVINLFRPEGYEEYFNPPKRIPFILMSGGEIGSEGSGIFTFGEFKLDNDSRP